MQIHFCGQYFDSTKITKISQNIQIMTWCRTMKKHMKLRANEIWKSVVVYWYSQIRGCLVEYWKKEKRRFIFTGSVLMGKNHTKYYKNSQIMTWCRTMKKCEVAHQRNMKIGVNVLIICVPQIRRSLVSYWKIETRRLFLRATFWWCKNHKKYHKMSKLWHATAPWKTYEVACQRNNVNCCRSLILCEY